MSVRIKPWGVVLEYPSRDEPERVCMDLCDVRAAAPIYIHYDFGRDGWAVCGVGGGHDEDDEPIFKELGFIENYIDDCL